MRGESARDGHQGRCACSGAVRGPFRPGRPSPGGRGVPIAQIALLPTDEKEPGGRTGRLATSPRLPVSPRVALTHGGGEPCDATRAAAGCAGIPAIRLHDYIAPGQRREAGLHPFGSGPGRFASPTPPDESRLRVVREPPAGRVWWPFVPAKWQVYAAKWQVYPRQVAGLPPPSGRFSAPSGRFSGAVGRFSGAVGRFWRPGGWFSGPGSRFWQLVAGFRPPERWIARI